jgi:DNA-binding PadR family transcriptional regulator
MMDERLRNLRKSMKKTVFTGLNFTESHKEQVKRRIASLNVKSEEEMIVAILHILSQEKTGFELTQSVRARGIQNFENHEGQLYMLLHRLEQKGYLQSQWKESEEKYYRVTNKGTRALALVDKKSSSSRSILKEIWEG